MITYISRQTAGHRKLTPESHNSLIAALNELAARETEDGRKMYEVVVSEMDDLSKADQIKLVSRTVIMIGIQ